VREITHLIHSFRKTYRNPIMIALGLNIERTWLRALAQLGWVLLSGVIGLALAVAVGETIWLTQGKVIDYVAIMLLVFAPIAIPCAIYAVDGVRQAPEFRS
jgi:hypothetical protein